MPRRRIRFPGPAPRRSAAAVHREVVRSRSRSSGRARFQIDFRGPRGGVGRIRTTESSTTPTARRRLGPGFLLVASDGPFVMRAEIRWSGARPTPAAGPKQRDRLDPECSAAPSSGARPPTAWCMNSSVGEPAKPDRRISSGPRRGPPGKLGLLPFVEEEDPAAPLARTTLDRLGGFRERMLSRDRPPDRCRRDQVVAVSTSRNRRAVRCRRGRPHRGAPEGGRTPGRPPDQSRRHRTLPSKKKKTVPTIVSNRCLGTGDGLPFGSAAFRASNRPRSRAPAHHPCSSSNSYRWSRQSPVARPPHSPMFRVRMLRRPVTVPPFREAIPRRRRTLSPVELAGAERAALLPRHVTSDHLVGICGVSVRRLSR